ncbi:MAG TPA: photosynthetic reaction center cytochrome c subunit family protein [Bryobacteraceae bacterium]|nr:photosynthetic reaction center cytochrome c subunit family protein [Bryobacteraceae bacterium]
MKIWMRRLTLAAAAIVLAFAVNAAISKRAAAQATASKSEAAAAMSGTRTAGQVFKNVTTSTLKGITVDDFMGSMGVMAAALGFDCSDCHTGAGTDKVDWVVDTPRKKMARKMVEMVAVINRDNFGGAQMVTCWTCHHGKDIPATTIALDHLYGPPNEETDDVITRDPDAPPASQILDKYIAALGGAEKLAGLKSYIATGTQAGYVQVKGGGQFEIYAQAPDKRTLRITFKDAPDRGNQTRAFDGTVGWVTTPRALLGEYKVTGTELDGLHLDAELAFPGQIKNTLTNPRVGYPDTVNGKEVKVVQGRGPRGILVTLYFDKESGLLVREIRFGRSPIGRVPVQADYGDYRDVDGIKFPFQYKLSWLDGRDSYEITDVKVNVPIDAKVFGQPSMSGAQ